MTRKLLLVSNTNDAHTKQVLGYCRDEIADFIGTVEGSREVLFLPYARPGGISCEDYITLMKPAFEEMGYTLISAYDGSNNNPSSKIAKARAIFVGGGNTFVLLKYLYDFGLLGALRNKIGGGTPYIGSSAGANIVCPTIATTNDNPIVEPRSLQGLGIVPFQIKPHYFEPPEGFLYTGETHAEKIKEYHAFNDRTVIGIREGSWLRIENNNVYLRGNTGAKVFIKGKESIEYVQGDRLDFLLD